MLCKKSCSNLVQFSELTIGATVTRIFEGSYFEDYHQAESGGFNYPVFAGVRSIWIFHVLDDAYKRMHRTRITLLSS